MKIIRAFWGDQESTWDEVPPKPLFDNEVVYVYGRENYERFRSMGYETVLIHYDSTELEHSTVYKHFVHKLECLKRAEHAYLEYLFLDWDVQIVKPLDDNFWNLIRTKGRLQCPLYAYPTNYENKVLAQIEQNPEKQWVKDLDPNIFPWLTVQNKMLMENSWTWEDLRIVPNFCFFYSNYTPTVSKLLEIYKERGILTCIEEFCMYQFANCSINEYIEKYEPIVIRGREDNCYHFDLTEDRAIERINNYIASKINKDIYLIHE